MLHEGDAIPTFSLPCDDGSTVRSGALGKAVLYFYPRDNTPGCTREAQAFTAQAKAFAKHGAKVYGISRDSLASHAKFRASCKLGIPLLSDTDLAVHKAFGAWGEKTMYGKKVEGVLRSTFVVVSGKITRVWPSVKVDGHAEAVLAFLAGAPASEAKAAKKPVASKPVAKKPAAKKPVAKKPAAKPSKKPAKKK